MYLLSSLYQFNGPILYLLWKYAFCWIDVTIFKLGRLASRENNALFTHVAMFYLTLHLDQLNLIHTYPVTITLELDKI